MNKGDKVRIKDTWGGPTSFDGFEAEVIEVDEYNGPYLKPLSDRPDGLKRREFYWPESNLGLISEEKPTIEVGDTVKATHAESGSVVQGVASYVDLNNDDLPTNVEIAVNQNSTGTLDLYAYQGWEFELIAKNEVPKPEPKVGDVVGDAASLPVGTVTRTSDFSGTYLHTAEGWHSKSGTLFANPEILDDTIIVYLPPVDSE